jgi:hypothetical protein
VADLHYHDDHGLTTDSDDLFKQLLEVKLDIANGVVTDEQLKHFCTQLGVEHGTKTEMQLRILAQLTDKLVAALPQPKKLKLSVSDIILIFLIMILAKKKLFNESANFNFTVKINRSLIIICTLLFINKDAYWHELIASASLKVKNKFIFKDPLNYCVLVN